MFVARKANKTKNGLSASGATSSHVQRKGGVGEFPRRLNFYKRPPTDQITIEQFETYALDRLKILKGLETAQIRNKSESELEITLKILEEEHMPLNANNNSDIARLDAERKKDNASHFILRLAYARIEDLRAWFVRQETLLFRLRLAREVESERNEFVKSLEIDMEPVSVEEKIDLQVDLAIFLGRNLKHEDSIYKVHWTRMLDLVARRKCLVRGGYAFISGNDLTSLVVNEYRNHLTKQMELTSRFLPRMDEDERLLPVLVNMSKQYLGKDQYDKVSGQISADEVDSLAVHFPPCMRHLHAQLKSVGHLRHGGRMQYGLFLKGIGLPIEEALTFWRRMFRHFTDDKFQKEYAYNIRHNYGLEGKRANYAPYACIRIITNNAPGSGDAHGCPFKHFSTENLRAAISSYGASDRDTADIVELAKQGHHQIACTRCFEATHPNVTHVDPIEHPNQYFAQSYNAAKATKAASGSGLDAAPPMQGPTGHMAVPLQTPAGTFGQTQPLAPPTASTNGQQHLGPLPGGHSLQPSSDQPSPEDRPISR